MPDMPEPLKTSFAKTPHDNLLLPSGKRLDQEPKLAAVLVGLGISGAGHSKGRVENAAAYAAHLDGIAKAGAEKAVAAWLKRPT
jgi:hypothetical protein